MVIQVIIISITSSFAAGNSIFNLEIGKFPTCSSRTGRYDHHCQWRYAPWPGCSRCCLLSKSIVKLGCLKSSKDSHCDSHCDSWILTCHDGLWAMRVDYFCELVWNTLKYEIRNAMRAEIEAGANVPWHHRIAHGFDYLCFVYKERERVSHRITCSKHL